MKFFKEHKLLTGLIIVFMIIIIGLIILISMLSGKTGNNEYGNRLDDIEKYEIGKSQISEIEEGLSSLEGVTSATYHLEGKLVNVIMDVEDTLAVDTAKSYANKVLEYIDDEQKAYYDIQIFITSDNEESENYPIILSKSKNSEGLI